MTLPPLPETEYEQVIEYSGIAVNRVDRFPLYTADQMRAYAQAAVLVEREACADICEDTSQEYEQYTGQELPLNMSCAAAIRARGE